MSYSISPVEEVDSSRIADLVCESIIQDGIPEYAAATWPGMDTEEGRAHARIQFLQMRKHLKEPSHFMKVVDQDSGSIVACSVCFHHETPPTSLAGLSGDAWKTQEERDYAEHLRRERNELLLRVYAQLQGPVTEIVAFFVDASCQRQGIGTTLMNHLMSSPEQKDVPLVLIARPEAKTFYEKGGFRVKEDIKLSVPKKWESRPPAHLISMIRGR